MALNILSLGAGVQSTTLALMAAHGEVTPMPDAAVFADTGAEPDNVYEHLRWLRSANVLPFRVHVVRRLFGLETAMLALADAGQGDDDYVYGGGVNIPLFTVNQDGSGGMMRRGCTTDWKVAVLDGYAKKLMKEANAEHAVKWIGYSLDELQRIKNSLKPWYSFRHPLIEKRMSRGDCLAWMERNGYPPPPKSACYFCPFKSRDSWRHMRETDPQTFERAVQFERRITHGLRGTTASRLFLTAARVPLNEVDLNSAEDDGQVSFMDECEGGCGL